MNKDNKSKKIISLTITLFIVMLLVSGGSYAYWTWITATSERTNVALTITAPEMSATLTGYTQNITNLIPVSSCTDSTYAIKKQLTLTYENLSENAGTITGTLSIEDFFSPYGTPDSDDLSHLHYAVTRSGNSCTTDIVRGGYGTFTSTSGNLFTDITLNGNVPSGASEESKTYYLWVWLDSEYTHQNIGSGVTNDPMQDIEFTLVWSGSLLNEGAEPEEPVLDTGMIPVTIANDGTVTTIASYDEDWYDYSNKEWANVVLVDNDSRSTYLNTSGKTINQSDILAYYVWIPRYSYKIPTMKCGELNNPSEEIHPECYKTVLSTDEQDKLTSWWYTYVTSNGITDYTEEQAELEISNGLETGVFNSITMEESIPMSEVVYAYMQANGISMINTTSEFVSTLLVGARPIDISFESTESSTLTGDAVNTYRTHPAFIWDGETIAGIWVGKFETSTDSSSTCYTSANETNCNNTDQSPRILPNVSSLMEQNISNQFQTSLKFAGGTLTDGTVTFAGSNTYGLTTNTDSHMMKNSEWGALAYLSHSQYGINYEIRINNYWNNGYFKTGCGASEENGSATSTCEITYGGASSYPQSTTGNISGVFDVSGGATEYTMGVLADDSGNPRSGTSLDFNSGFNGLFFDGSSYTEGIAFPIAKYYNLYTSENSLTACNGGICYGHGLSETSGWYNDLVDFLSIDQPWYGRGGTTGSGVEAGAFYLYSGVGDGSYISWRSALIVE